MAFVTVHTGGVYGDSNIYEGRDVVVIYWKEFVGWVVEEGVVENGKIELAGDGPMPDQKYWVGIKYKSTMKTFPLRAQGKVNPKARLSKVNLYIDKQSGEFNIEVGDETGPSSSSVISPKLGGKLKSRHEVNIGTSYVEEPYIKVESYGIEPVKILGVDADFRVYER